MNWLLTSIILYCLMPPVCLAQTKVDPSQRLQQKATQAEALYEKHAYAQAAAIVEQLAADPQIIALPEWSNMLYDRARYEALAGHAPQAILSLRQAINRGSTPSVSHIREDPDLVSLHNDPGFQELLFQITRVAMLWNDNPAIATSYKPELTEDEKVAGLSKFWSEARFNFPFFARLPQLDWDRLYMEYLPQVRIANTTVDYYRVLMRFAASLHDGHTEIRPPKELSDTFYATPLLRTEFIDDKVLITEVSDPALTTEGVRVGVEVVAVDGQPVKEYAEQHVAPYVNGFTEQDRNVRLYDYQLFSGPVGEPVLLSLRRADGKIVSVSLPRKHFDPKALIGDPVQFRTLAGNIAYLRVSEFNDDLGAKTMRDNFATIVQADGLIIDVRRNAGGNSLNGYAILSMLTERPFSTSHWRTLDYKPAYRAWRSVPGWWEGTGWMGATGQVDPDGTHFFTKPVAVLIGPRTYSAGEDFVVAFDAMHRGTLMGDATGGSTGNPLLFKLPGGGSAIICTKDDSYPDGRVFEGIGILPQVRVSPSISDLRNGKDSVLDRAAEILRQQRP